MSPEGGVVLVTDRSKQSPRAKGKVPGEMLAGIEPETAAALRALLMLGGTRQETLESNLEADIESFVRTEVARPEWLQAVTSAGGLYAGAVQDAGSESILPGLGAEDGPGVQPIDGDHVARALLLLSDARLRDALVGRLIDQFEEVALQHNQFLLFGERERAGLRAVHEAFLDELMVELSAGPSLADTAAEPSAFESLTSLVVEHQRRLWQFAQSLLKGQLGSEGLWTPPCHEYDPEFQLALWHVSPPELREPVLDLGCGPNALLVHYLREAGLQAWGLDRFDDGGQYVLRGDWLETPLEPNYWGTIISHMGFSNHFFHHHLRKDGHPERYARRFMEIVDGLQPGGRFLYAPGLPFFEPLLPEDRVGIVHHPINVDVDAIADMTDPKRARDPLDVRQPALYATEIRRM